MKIEDNKFIALRYDLNVGEGDDRELMEQATTEHPLTFMYGMGMMLESFEKNIEGLQTGDTFSFKLLPGEAYGEYIQEHVVELPKNIFEIDGKFDGDQVFEGATLPMMDSNGHQMNGSVLEVKDDIVIMDFNHPLAGETLSFDGEVLEVREPTAEEIAAITSGCGGGCGGNCSEGCDCGDESEANKANGSCGCGGCGH